jgi:hypothetical protein
LVEMVLLGTNTLAYSSAVTEKKKFYKIETSTNMYENFVTKILVETKMSPCRQAVAATSQNSGSWVSKIGLMKNDLKLECMCLARLSSLV